MLSPQPQSTPAHRRFHTTRWSLIQRAGGDDSDRELAMTELCQLYWFPIYAHIRRQGHPQDAAQDLTQEFFARLLGGDDLLDGFEPDRGRFRNYVRGAVNHFLANEWDRSQALKRGGGVQTVSLDVDLAESRLKAESPGQGDPDREFESRWARSILERVFETLKAEHVASRKASLFAELYEYLAREPGQDSCADIGNRIGMSEGAVRVAIHRLRKRYGVLVRQEVAQTLASDEQVDDEIHRLFQALSES